MRKSDIIDELKQIKFCKRPIHYAYLIRLALLLRYTSVSSYKLLMDELYLPSLLLLSKTSQGKIVVFKAAKLLKENGNISEDVVLLFDEIHLQKCEDYVGGDMVFS